MANHYQNSLCDKQGMWLHKFSIVKQINEGLLERCERCKATKFFPSNVPSHVYLSYHIRQAIQLDDPRFKREFPNFDYANVKR